MGHQQYNKHTAAGRHRSSMQWIEGMSLGHCAAGYCECCLVFSNRNPAAAPTPVACLAAQPALLPVWLPSMTCWPLKQERKSRQSSRIDCPAPGTHAAWGLLLLLLRM